MPVFRKSFKHGVDLNLAGHLHLLNETPPLNPDGEIDWKHGIQTIVVGTGGAILFPDPRQDTTLPRPERKLKWGDDVGEVLLANTPGLVKIDLVPGSYHWQFIPISPEPGHTYPSDSGTCHPNPPGYVEPLETP